MESPNSLAIQPNVFYTVEETAHLLRASQPNVRKLIRSGTVRGIKVGREWRILGGELLDLGARWNDTDGILVAEWLDASRRSLAKI